jgi:hypothetical protein
MLVVVVAPGFQFLPRMVVRLFVADLAGEFRAVIHRDRPGKRMLRTEPLEGLDETSTV